MNIHSPRLWLHQNYDLIKHWLFLLIGFTLIVFALLSYANSNHLLKQVNVLAAQNKVLSEQNKALNQATNSTGDATQKVVLQNRDNINCLAKVFAQYTHNFVPITISDLQGCVVSAGTSGTDSAGSPSLVARPAASSISPSPSASGPAPSQASSGSPSSPNLTTPPPTPKPNLLQRLLTNINPFN